ncbi:MAG TPA: DNA recombination/repair protein RecA, partial [Allosphingosinicella sp.]
ENAKTYLRENPELAARLERAIRGKTDAVADALMVGPGADDDL